MDGLAFLLQLHGIVNAAPEEQADLTKFDAVLVGHDELSHPRDRFKYVANLLQSYKDRTPILPDPGRSLCKSCNSIAIDTLYSEEGYIHSECYWELVASAEVSWCPLCVLLVNALRGTESDDFGVGAKLINPLRTDVQIRLRAGQEESEAERNKLEVMILNTGPVVPSGKLSILPARDVPDNSTHQSMEEGVKFTTLKCLVEDQHLQDVKVPPALPTRVLDVSRFAPLDEDVRLVETNSLSSGNAPYVALSYRWGNTNNLTTTIWSLQDRIRCIGFSEMPRTLQDAVIVTRRLGLRFLWVDALCIVQDDKSDWLQEAGKMGDIYMHSYCTIAAHAAQHADHGFLEQALATPRMVRIEQFCITQGSNKKLHIEETDLNSRGWVLQEWLLSPRTIHFANDGAIYFESGAGIHLVQDKYDATRNYHLRSPGIRSMVQQLIRSEQEIMESESKLATLDQIYYDWYDIVEHYSRCSLTKPSDKLPALTGIIRQIHAFTEDECYMGVWQRKLPHCLLWLRGEEALKAPTEYRAPSWSWAAYDGEMQFLAWRRYGHDKTLISEFSEAVFHSSAHSEHNAAGILAGPISMVIQDVKMIRNISRRTGYPDSGTGLRFMDGQLGRPGWIQSCNWEPLKTETQFWAVHDDRGRRIGWASLDREESVEIDGEEHHITCIAVASYTDDNPETALIRGHLVLFIQMLTVGVWVRVGMGQIDQGDWFKTMAPMNVVLI